MAHLGYVIGLCALGAVLAMLRDARGEQRRRLLRALVATVVVTLACLALTAAPEPVRDRGHPGIEVRLHATTQYASLYRADHVLQFTLAFRTRVLGGQLARDCESHELRWVAKDELDNLRIHPSMRLRINHYFEARDDPYLG